MNHFANSMLDFSCRLLLSLSQTLISVNLISFLHCVYRRCCCAKPTSLYITAQEREWNFKRRKREKNKVFHLRNWFFVNPPLLTSNFSLFSIHTHSWLLLLIFLSSFCSARLRVIFSRTPATAAKTLNDDETTRSIFFKSSLFMELRSAALLLGCCNFSV